MNKLLNDTRFSMRSLWKRPGFTFVAILTLALGIGGTTAIFSVVNAVLLKPLPFANSDRLAMVWERKLGDPSDWNVVSPANFVDWDKQQGVFEQMAGFWPTSRILTGDMGESDGHGSMDSGLGSFERRDHRGASAGRIGYHRRPS